ncbi:AI-2E family transporter [Zhouia spongiae]|uniref:AI-2E family transporter n=1 Tax=Zhouia spongiae TaxID=2202721 RepID=A0ABY3YJ94_9FLAO|nr:AI-2E family transporter [Zhouia spongiae]UNY97921.1 AI-2E family transporter [Zhouia spongiae]
MENNNFKNRRHQGFVSLLMVTALFIFIVLIKDYIIAIVLAIIFAGLLFPTYNWLLNKTRQRKTLSSILTIFLFLLIIVVPTMLLLQQIIHQGTVLSEHIFPYIKQQLSQSSHVENSLPEWLPFKKELTPHTQDIFSKLSEFMQRLSGIVINALTAFTQETFSLFINLFVMIYAIYYFLQSGKGILNKMHHYIPLTDSEFNLIINRVKEVSRATIKGAISIGIIQGALVALGFWVTGIEGAAFWGSVAAIMSLIPSVGTAIVYVPAGIYLIMTGDVIYGTGLLIWGVGVVSSVDNFLRPVLVGKDTQIPDLLILISTLGGIGLFGISGIIIGPMLAGLLITIVEIYKDTVS